MKDLLKALQDQPQLGFMTMYPLPGAIERIGPLWDWIWIDGQHGQLDYKDILDSVRACNLVSRPAIVRVPGHEVSIISRMLDTAAAGIMVPMVDTAEQAAQIVQSTKFAPIGNRSFGGRRPIDMYTRAYANADHVQPILICQIETSTALKNVNEIANVEGVDALFFGPDDMGLSRGYDMAKPFPAGCFDEAYVTVAEAAKSAGIIAGGVFTTPEAFKTALSRGYRLTAVCTDVALLALGAKSQADAMRECL